MFTSSAEVLNELYAYKRSVILMAACKEGLFFEIGKKPISAEDYAAKKGWKIPQTVVFLRLLKEQGLLEFRDGKYHCSNLSKKFLDDNSESYLGYLVKLETKIYHEMIDDNSIIKGLKGVSTPLPSDCEDIYMKAMEYGVKYAAVVIVKLVKKYITVNKVLDLGGGPGEIAATFCKLCKNSSAVVFDLPEMRSYAQENVVNKQMEKKIQLISGDCLIDNWGKNYDVIVISNLLHFFDKNNIVEILNKAYKALNYNGIVVVHDFFTGEESTEIAELSVIDWLVMGVAFDYTLNEFADSVELETNFKVIERRKLNGPPTSLIVLQASSREES